jgi:hypothetical protein
MTAGGASEGVEMSDAERGGHAMREPLRGSIVRYRVDGSDEQSPVASGVVTGPIECDPATDQLWVGIRTLWNDRKLTPDLITMASIVHVEPPSSHRGTEPR